MTAVSLAVLAVGLKAQSQGIIATGTFTSTPSGGGSFNYVINLQNSSASTSAVGTFWYAWLPGQFFLPSDPSSVTAPTGWTFATPSGGDFSIEFTDNSPTLNLIQPGASLNFGFTSVDSPATIGAITGVNGTSVLYSGNSPFSGNSLDFNVTPVPEPSSLGLVTIGLVGLLLLARRTPLLS